MCAMSTSIPLPIIAWTMALPSAVSPFTLRHAESTSKPSVNEPVVTPQSVSMWQFSRNSAAWKMALCGAAPAKRLSSWCTGCSERTPRL